MSIGTAPSYSAIVWITVFHLIIILAVCIRTLLICSLLQTEHKLWFILIVAKLIWTHSIHWFYLHSVLHTGIFYSAVKHTLTRDHSWGGECEVWPFYPLSSPWGSTWVQYSGGVPLWLLMSPIQYETRLEGSSSIHTQEHTHTHSHTRCLSLTCTSLLSWLLMWRQPSDAFSHHSCSLSLPHHSLTLCPHTSPAYTLYEINRWIVWFLMHKSQQGRNINFFQILKVIWLKW